MKKKSTRKIIHNHFENTKNSKLLIEKGNSLDIEDYKDISDFLKKNILKVPQKSVDAILMFSKSYRVLKFKNQKYAEVILN
jgi:hypothetical protein